MSTKKNGTDKTMQMITSAGLAARAMETTLRKHCWPGKMIDRSVDATIEEAHLKDCEPSKATTTQKKLVDGKYEPLWKAVEKLSRDLGKAWKKDTVIWRDGGTRLIASTRYMEFAPRIALMRDEYHAAVRLCAESWDEIVQRQKGRLGDLWVLEHFPTAEELVEKCYATLDYQPIQTADDFRIDLPEEWMDDLRQANERATQRAIENAMRDPWERLKTVVEAMAKALSIPDKIFRDSLIGNVENLLDLMPDLNVTGDPTLEAMCSKIRKALTQGFDAKDVRDPAYKAKQDTDSTANRSSDAKTLRESKALEARDILAEINSVM